MISAAKVRTWYRVHKWTSLICTLFLLTACLTGLPLIFHDELDPFFNHEARPTEMPAGAPLAKIDPMVAQAQQQMPGLRPFSVFLDDEAPRVLVYFTPTQKAANFRSLAFDAHTGKLLEAAAPGKDLLSRLLELHSALFLGLPGELLMGVMAVLFVVSLISGFLVYGPFMRRLPFGTFRREPVRLRWFDLHNLLGIVTMAWMLVVGATGVMNALSTPLFGLWRMQTLPTLLASYRGKPIPARIGSVDAAFAKASETLPSMQATSLLFPNGEEASPQHFLVWTKGKTPVTSRLFTPVLIDATTGAVTAAQPLPWYLRALEVSRPLHFGDYGGMPLKVLWALFDIALIAVLGSGVYLWLFRRRTPVKDELDRLVRVERGELQVEGVLP